MIGGTALIYKKYKYKRMTRDEEDDDVWNLKDDECSLKFAFNWSIRIEEFLQYFNRN